MEVAVKRKRGRPRKNPLPEPPPVAEQVPEKRKRGRPRKNPLPTAAAVPQKPKLDYYVLTLDDIELWAVTTEREMFRQAVSDYKKLVKSKFSPEIRWYKDKIVVQPAGS